MGKNKEETKSKNYKSAVFYIRGAPVPGARSSGRLNIFTVAPSTCGVSVWNSFRVTFLAPRVSSCRLDLSKMCILDLDNLGAQAVAYLEIGLSWFSGKDWAPILIIFVS